MSATIACPICRRASWYTADGLAYHLERDHAPRAVAEQLAEIVAAGAIVERVSTACPTGKVRFETERDARVELCGAVIGRNRGKHQRRECRVYECDRCGGWHMTSMQAAPGTATA